jgi:coenzyme F420-reducing hydrogenase delta subunit
LPAEIVVFSCNWNGWSCLEAATGAGLGYPAAVKVIRVSCLSRIHAGLILKAFELGAGGVMLAGCEVGDCPFGADAECIRREYEKARRILAMLGIRQERLVLARLPAFDGPQFVTQVTKLLSELERKPAGTAGSRAG